MKSLHLKADDEKKSAVLSIIPSFDDSTFDCYAKMGCLREQGIQHIKECIDHTLKVTVFCHGSMVSVRSRL